MRIIFLTLFFFSIFISPVFAYQATFSPAMELSARYIDNIDLTASDDTYDILTTISPQFVYNVLGAKSGINFSASPQFRNYERGYQENQVFYNASVSAWAGIAKNTRIQISDTLFSSDDPVVEDDTTVRRNREYYYRNSTSLRLVNTFGVSDSIFLAYNYSFLENDDPLVEDNESFQPSFGIQYGFGARWAIRFNMSYTDGRFDESDGFDNVSGMLRLSKSMTTNLNAFLQYSHTMMNYRGISPNYQVYDPSIGISFELDENYSFSIRLAYLVQDRQEGDDLAGLTISGNLQRNWQLRRGGISVSGESGYNESYFGTENLGFEMFYQASFSANFRITKLIDANISTSSRYDDYKNLETDRNDLTLRAGAGLTWTLQKYIRMNLNYSYRTVSSTTDADDYIENQVLLTVNLSPALPIRTN